ncbi:MAG: alanine--tRNA ligase [Hadesarchaea archaeon]|nr:MAG: alanine--tRNA ligase [Hadesarchaea archaeon]
MLGEASQLKDIYRVKLFKHEGFQRKKCVKCGRLFWTVDPERKTCGDTPCDEYSFIDCPPTKRKYTLEKMEKNFLNFFAKHGHEIIDRYPVVARWRDDIFLTIASIADFQPWVTTGQVPPPANPLVISQPSIRLNDMDNVGRSGKHFTLFFMGGHHAFNSRRKRIYWNDETVALCHEFLTKELGIKSQEITYIQDFWEGGGNAGEDFEVNIRGLEIATLVFMQYASADGKRVPLPLKVVDTGYGIERLVWLSQGTATSYEAIFGPLVEHLRKLSGVHQPPVEVLRENSKLAGMIDIESGRDLKLLRSKVASRTGLSVDELNRILTPLERIYAIADHLRCLAFMFGDGITPSNVREGYLARSVLRHTLELTREMELNTPLVELMAFELKHLAKQFPELEHRKNYVLEVTDAEEKRYREAVSRGTRIVKRIAGELRSKGEPISQRKLIELYDTYGLTPEIVKKMAAEVGVDVDVPDDFYIKVAESHSRAKRAEASVPPVSAENLRSLPPTRQLYYENPYAVEFRARVLNVFGEYVVLNQTMFYPEGGGQPADTGSLESGNAKVEVVDVIKVEDVILHRVKPPSLKRGDQVAGRVDWSRRRSLMAHHTGTHILLGAARRVLGDHVWQQGAQKGVDRSRLDISHFRRVGMKELREIERLSNEVITEDREVKATWMDRNQAERKYGFDLYQGGVVPGKRVRVVDIKGWNTQACAGTHCKRTGEVGLLKILRTERIQDGIERIEFATGLAALNFIQAQEEQLTRAAEILRTSPERVAAKTRELFEQWKAAEKEVKRLRQRIAESQLPQLRRAAKTVGEIRVICEEVEGASVDEMIKIASSLIKGDEKLVVILASRDETIRLVAMAGEEAVKMGVNCGSMISEASKVLEGGGGGRSSMGQGGGPRTDRLGVALRRALEICEKQIKG